MLTFQFLGAGEPDLYIHMVSHAKDDSKGMLPAISFLPCQLIASSV